MKDDRNMDMGSNDLQRCVRFGAFEANFHTGELWKHGIRLKLSGQPFQILESLLSRPGELVSRDELQKRLWPDAPFTDSNHGLNAAVNKLRETLGDSAEHPKYIETLPRRGYRFIGSIGRESSPQSALQPGAVHLQAAPALPPPSPVVERIDVAASFVPAATGLVRRWLATAASLGILLGGIGVVSFVGKSLLGSGADSSVPNRELANANPLVRTEPAKDEVPAQRQKADRNLAILSEPASAIPPAVLREASTMEPTTRTIISGDGGAAAPQFSPDGKRIAFMSNRTGPWQIWMSNADGSNPVQVSFTDSAGTPRWSPDGRSIAFDGPGENGASIFVVSADGSRRVIPVAEGLVPSYSRDGEWIYFASDRTGDWQVWKVRSSGGSAIQVTHDGGFAALEGLDGYLYYAKSRYPTPEVWRVPLAGGEEELVSPHLRPRTWSSWTVTRTGILFVEDLRDGKTTLSLYDPAKRMVRDLAPLQTAPFWMAATFDGKRAIMNDAREQQITMMENLP